MPHTYSTIWFHIVFAAKDRKPLIDEHWKNDLYGYIGGVTKQSGASLVEINGMEDHLHLLINTRPNLRIDYLVRDIKSDSTKWLHQENISQIFNWQRGYGAFSVSESQVEKVVAYIKNQKEHHKKRSFEEEFKQMLKAHNIQYEEKYLWT